MNIILLDGKKNFASWYPTSRSDQSRRSLTKLCINVCECECVLRYIPHCFIGSSDQSLQSLMLSHTLLLSIHSPLLHMNFSGPSHLVAVRKHDRHFLDYLFLLKHKHGHARLVTLIDSIPVVMSTH